MHISNNETNIGKVKDDRAEKLVKFTITSGEF